MKKQIPYKFILPESELPKAWYNVKADMKIQPENYLNPGTGKPMTVDELSGLFARELMVQELSCDRYIDIPTEVLEKYKLMRATPLHRAYNLEKELGTPAKIYYKYEGANPSGSHKLNSAIPQAYYNKAQGIKRLTTETGAGQWGTALSIACAMYGLECVVYMVKISAQQKTYRKLMMETFGAKVFASPSNHTNAGRAMLEKDPDSNGSLGMAISEAIEDAVTHDNTNYALGSVLNHVCLHQTIIGLEAKAAMEYLDEYPDIVIACNGGGSNFSGIAYPFLMDKLQGKSKTRFIAVEASACPKLTKGKFAFDFGDTAMTTPLMKMYTLGHDFRPAGIHAGGLRYHGDSGILSQLYHDGFVEAAAVNQQEVFDAAMKFAKAEALLPAPESSHAICQAIKEAEKCKETGEEKVILFNLSGNGYFDLKAFEQHHKHELIDDIASIDSEIARAQNNIPKF